MNSRLLPLAFVFASVIAAPAFAQERTAAVPTNNASDLTNDALMRKLSHQTQVINTLQAQLRSCQTGEAFNPSLPTDTSGFDAPRTRTPEATGDMPPPPPPAYTTQFNTQQTAPSAPPRRSVGVYQQPAEPKLTCADYSTHYFSRHPAMAAVCGVSVSPQPQAPASVPEAPHDESDVAE